MELPLGFGDFSGGEEVGMEGVCGWQGFAAAGGDCFGLFLAVCR